jgi:hypothetical protein
VVAAGLAACSGANLPKPGGVFETIGATEDTGDEGSSGDEDSTGGVSTTGIDPTTPGDTSAGETDGTTAAADTTSAADDESTSSSGAVDESPATTSTSETVLACVDEDLGEDVGDGIASGSSASGDDMPISCARGGGADVVLSWTAPSAGSWTFDLSGSDYDTALAVIQPDCDGAEVACNDDAIGLASMLTLDLAADEQVLLVVDGYDGAVGDYVLDVNPAADLSCADEDLADLTGAVASGSTVGESNSFAIGCAGGGGADYAFAWIAPASGTWNFATAGSTYDTALSIWAPDCGGDEIACNDDTLVDVTSVLDVDLQVGEQVIVVVDGYMGDSGNFSLTIQ